MAWDDTSLNCPWFKIAPVTQHMLWLNVLLSVVCTYTGYTLYLLPAGITIMYMYPACKTLDSLAVDALLVLIQFRFSD